MHQLFVSFAQEDVDSTVKALVKALRAHPLGEKAAVIGEVVDEHHGFVMMKTRVGGTRVVDMLSGGQLPRIC
jgi:hydrogenase expression/formation protein HypE